MRFCLCSTFYPPYGSDTDAAFVQALAVGLARRGHDVTVLHNPDAYDVLHGGKVSESGATWPGLTIRPVTARLKAGSLIAMQQSGRMFGLRRRLRECLEQPFDVIHFHNVSLLGGPEIFSLGSSEVKLASFNDHWLVCPTHLLWKYTGEPCESAECIRCSLHYRRPPQFWRYTRLMDDMARHVDVFLAPSLFTLRIHSERGFDHPMIHLPPVCPVPERTASNLAALPTTQPYFLCAGRLEYYKGFQDVIPAFRDLEDHALILCGDGSCGRELRALARGMSNVHFAGALPPGQLHELYASAVATIVPTLAYQTLCHSTAESFSAGTPVIARRIGPAEEIVTRHGGGLLYSSADELREAMSRLIADAPLRLKLAGEAHQAYLREFSEDVYLERYLAIVEQVRAGKAARAAGAR